MRRGGHRRRCRGAWPPAELLDRHRDGRACGRHCVGRCAAIRWRKRQPGWRSASPARRLNRCAFRHHVSAGHTQVGGRDVEGLAEEQRQVGAGPQQVGAMLGPGQVLARVGLFPGGPDLLLPPRRQSAACNAPQRSAQAGTSPPERAVSARSARHRSSGTRPLNLAGHPGRMSAHRIWARAAASIRASPSRQPTPVGSVSPLVDGQLNGPSRRQRGDPPPAVVPPVRPVCLPALKAHVRSLRLTARRVRVQVSRPVPAVGKPHRQPGLPASVRHVQRPGRVRLGYAGVEAREQGEQEAVGEHGDRPYAAHQPRRAQQHDIAGQRHRDDPGRRPGYVARPGHRGPGHRVWDRAAALVIRLASIRPVPLGAAAPGSEMLNSTGRGGSGDTHH